MATALSRRQSPRHAGTDMVYGTVCTNNASTARDLIRRTRTVAEKPDVSARSRAAREISTWNARNAEERTARRR